MKDIGNNARVTASLAFAENRTATATGTYVKVTDFTKIMALVHIGTIDTVSGGNHYFTITAYGATSDAGAGATLLTTYNPQTEDGSTWDYLIDNAADANTLKAFGIDTAGFDYVAIKATETGTADMDFGAALIMADPLTAPS